MIHEYEPCIGLLELASIARGIEVTDAVLKTAEVTVLFARPFSPGKYAVLFTGPVDAVRSSLARGAEIAGDDRLDEVLIPGVAEGVIEALARPVEVPELDAVGIIETTTIASALLAADAAAKQASVTIFEMRLAQGIGGKSYFTFTGSVGDVEAATQAGAMLAAERNALVRRVVVPRPHPEMRDWLGRHDLPI